VIGKTSDLAVKSHVLAMSGEMGLRIFPECGFIAQPESRPPSVPNQIGDKLKPTDPFWANDSTRTTTIRSRWSGRYVVHFKAGESFRTAQETVLTACGRASLDDHTSGYRVNCSRSARTSSPRSSPNAYVTNSVVTFLRQLMSKSVLSRGFAMRPARVAAS
jgi:hypothetical protein